MKRKQSKVKTLINVRPNAPGDRESYASVSPQVEHPMNLEHYNKRQLTIQEAASTFANILGTGNEQKLYILLRYGLADLSQFELFKMVLARPDYYIKTQQYRDILLKVLKRLINLVTKDEATYQKAYQALFRNKRIVESASKKKLNKRVKTSSEKTHTEKIGEVEFSSRAPTNEMIPLHPMSGDATQFSEGFEPRALGEPELTKRYKDMTPGQKEVGKSIDDMKEYARVADVSSRHPAWKHLDAAQKAYNNGNFDTANKHVDRAVQSLRESLNERDDSPFERASDTALDAQYGYGTSYDKTSKKSFGRAANRASAAASLKLLRKDVNTPVEAGADAVHQGWAKTAKTSADQTPEKKAKRAILADTPYSNLPDDEKEKDRVAFNAVKNAYLKRNEETINTIKSITKEKVLSEYAASAGRIGPYGRRTHPAILDATQKNNIKAPRKDKDKIETKPD